MVNEHIDPGNELASLRCPVAHDGRRCDHERGTSLTRQRDAREGRRCLAETHIERQAPAEPGIVEEGEPSERIGLIGPEFTVNPSGVVVGSSGSDSTLRSRSAAHPPPTILTPPESGEPSSPSA